MKKRKPWKREARCLYRMFLQNTRKAKNIKKAIGYYQEYNDLIQQAEKDPNCPKSIKASLGAVGTYAVKMPKYFEWAKQYMVEKDV